MKKNPLSPHYPAQRANSLPLPLLTIPLCQHMPIFFPDSSLISLLPLIGAASRALSGALRLERDQRHVHDALLETDPFDARSLPDIRTIGTLEDRLLIAKLQAVAVFENHLRIALLQGETPPWNIMVNGNLTSPYVLACSSLFVLLSQTHLQRRCKSA